MFHFIDRVGVEIEGAWHKTFADVDIHNDESVYCPPEVDKATGHWGEVGTGIGGVSYQEAVEFIKTHLPDGVFTGEVHGRKYTCGMHIHVSLKKVAFYLALSTREFFEHFYSECAIWGSENKLPDEHEYWDRIAGRNRYCRKIFRPQKQITLIEKHNNEDRRTGINYCFTLHETVEFRLFPQWVKGEEKLAVGCLDLVVNTVEGWLAAHPPKVSGWRNTVRAKNIKHIREVRKELEI